MNIGYTCFVNRNLNELVSVLINALNNFSKYKVELFTINYDSDIVSDNLIKRRIDINPETRENIFNCKLYASFSSDFDFALIFDADMIPNKNIDELLEENYYLYKDSIYPVCAHHPHNPWKNLGNEQNIQKLMSILNISELKIPYKYGSYFFTKNSKDFFKEAFDISQDLQSRGILPFSCDETIINLLLNKYDAINQLDYNYLPNYWLYKDVMNGNLETNQSYITDYKNWNCPVRPYIFHGCKDYNQASIIYKEISEKI